MSHANFHSRCDTCGKFMRPGSPGSSWVMVPAVDFDFGDERERCAACTKSHGPAECEGKYVKHLCCGVVGEMRK